MKKFLFATLIYKKSGVDPDYISLKLPGREGALPHSFIVVFNDHVKRKSMESINLPAQR